MFKTIIAFSFLVAFATSQLWMSDFALKRDIVAATNGLTNSGGGGSTGTVTNQSYLVYTIAGNLIVASNQVQAHIPYNCTFGSNAAAAVFTAQTGTNRIIYDLTINGATILSNAIFASNSLTNYSRIYATNASIFDQLAIHIIQVGADVQGSDLTIIIPITQR